VPSAENSNIPLTEPGQSRPPVWLPLFLLVALTGLVRFLDLDRQWEHEFWTSQAGWSLAEHPVVRFLYHYGTWPALLVGGISGLVWMVSHFTNKWTSLRPRSLFLALLLVLGPGVVVNTILKEHWRRPRPVQTAEFGGRQPFRPVGAMGRIDEGKSFPSGHASMGFYWLGLLVYFWNDRRRLAWAFGGLGLFHGLSMAIGRMAQGGHWFTDVLWSAGLVYGSAWVLHYVLCHRPPTSFRSCRSPEPFEEPFAPPANFELPTSNFELRNPPRPH